MTKTTLTYISNTQNLKYCSLANIIACQTITMSHTNTHTHTRTHARTLAHAKKQNKQNLCIALHTLSMTSYAMIPLKIVSADFACFARDNYSCGNRITEASQCQVDKLLCTISYRPYLSVPYCMSLSLQSLSAC